MYHCFYIYKFIIFEKIDFMKKSILLGIASVVASASTAKAEVVESDNLKDNIIQDKPSSKPEFVLKIDMENPELSKASMHTSHSSHSSHSSHRSHSSHFSSALA